MIGLFAAAAARVRWANLKWAHQALRLAFVGGGGDGLSSRAGAGVGRVACNIGVAVVLSLSRAMRMRCSSESEWGGRGRIGRKRRWVRERGSLSFEMDRLRSFASTACFVGTTMGAMPGEGGQTRVFER